MIVVSDAVGEIDWTTHEAGLTIMNRIFADVKTTDKVVRMFHNIRSEGSWEMVGGYPKLIPLGAAPLGRDIRW
jgi:hypothetical protein